MYKVVKRFYDLQDGGFLYKEGDIYPRNQKKTSKKRLDELLSKSNKMGVQLITEIVEKPKENKQKVLKTYNK